MTTTHRHLILDDGVNWETVSESSRALIVRVTDEELERLEAGEHMDAVLGERLGRRLAPLLEPPVFTGCDATLL